MVEAHPTAGLMPEGGRLANVVHQRGQRDRARSPMNNSCFGPSRLANVQVSDLRLIAKPSYSAAS
jgi:hypothetical protein